MDKNLIEVWTDGSCYNKMHNAGGYGIVLKWNGYIKKVSGGSYINTTSSRMEIKAVIESFKQITNKQLKLKIHVDNQYVVNSWERGWVLNWEKNKFVNRKNSDLWIEFLKEIRKFNINNISLVWVRGHNGNKYNEIADRLAKDGGAKKTIIKDKK